MSIAPGTRLGPYEILSPLGAGGMGEVYRARDTRLERTVAIKVLPDHLSKDEDARQRFEREARTISSLSHPHICALYDVGSQEGVEYLVMELLEGETLGERLANGALPIEQVLRYGIEMAAALEKAQHFGAGALAAGQSIDLLHRSGPSAAVGRFRPGFAPGRNTDSTRRPVAGFSPEYVIESLGISPNGSKLTISTGNEFATIMLAEGVPGAAPPVRNLR